MKLNQRGMDKIRRASTNKLRIDLAQRTSKTNKSPVDLAVIEAVTEELKNR